MKKLLLFCLLLFAGSSLLAQKVYFIYIQSDAHTPFYVRMGDKVISSTASGYLILPRLKDSTYTLRLGPSANESELRFEVPLLGKDRGFLLKKFTEGWGLFDLQSLQRINPDNGGGGAATGVKLQEDRFALLLAKAANDTTLLYQPVVAVTPPPDKKKKKNTEVATVQKEAVAGTISVAPDTVASEQQDTKESSDLVQTATVAPPETPEPSSSKSLSHSADATAPDNNFSNNDVFKRSLVTRRSESSTVEGFGLVYLDDNAGVVDTIRLVIPNQKVVFAEAAPAVEEKAPEVKKSAAPALACSGQASEKDFFKLRKSLASVDAESDMNKIALAAFRKNCFSTVQVKNLSSLFLTQAGKYAFLETAYPFVYDKEQFATLQSEIFDPAYLTRFKTLTSN
jgi:hypothetical protein